MAKWLINTGWLLNTGCSEYMLNKEDAIFYHIDHLMHSLHKGIYKVSYLVEKLQNIV